HRLAVGPAQPAAQIEREGLAVVAHLPGLGERRAHPGSGIVDKHRAIRGIDAIAVLIVARPGKAASPSAAVLPDLRDRLDHHKVLRQPILDRRQLALLDQLRELRSLIERFRPLSWISYD